MDGILEIHNQDTTEILDVFWKELCGMSFIPGVSLVQQSCQPANTN